MSDILLMESDGGVVRLTLNRPEKRNALSHELFSGLELALGNDRGGPGRPGRRPGLARPGLLFGARPGGDGRADRSGLSRALRTSARA